jgi:hypothetical protein
MEHVPIQWFIQLVCDMVTLQQEHKSVKGFLKWGLSVCPTHRHPHPGSGTQLPSMAGPTPQPHTGLQAPQRDPTLSAAGELCAPHYLPGRDTQKLLSTPRTRVGQQPRASQEFVGGVCQLPAPQLSLTETPRACDMSQSPSEIQTPLALPV